MARACARVDSGLDKQKYPQTVVSTRIVPGCMQFLGEEKRFYTAWVNSGLILAPIVDAGVGAAVRSTAHGSVVASLQKRNRNPTVGAMLLCWRKPEANPPFTCVNMIPE